ncbi:MAG TPA: RNA polymerase sigma factor [Candidatus Limnocylindrales bacterium]|nr:RNA polymerase sigma factor [Candidatus Limnocylindrales bacterium]
MSTTFLMTSPLARPDDARDAHTTPGVVRLPDALRRGWPGSRTGTVLQATGGRPLTRDLVERAKHGDHDAFATLVLPEIHRLHGLAGLILRDRARAEDAMQEALLKAWRDLPGLRDAGSFQPWLRRLLVNACHDEGRRLGRRRGEVSLGPEHDESGPNGVADDVSRRDELARGFRRLSDEERTVISLSYYLDLSTADASAALGVRENTYRSKLHRAIGAMRAALAADARQTEGPQT